jgi:hypothetical protein
MIRFVGGTVGGIAITTYHDVRVQIRHELREGYIPSANGDMIREEMPLREFLERIFKEGREVENELYRVSKCMSGGYQYNDNELDRITDTYDAMYSNLIRRGKIVLAQHKIRQDMIGGIDPYQEQRRREAMSGAQQMDSEHYRRQAMMQQMAARPNPGQFLGVMQEDPSIKQMHKEALEKDKIKQEKKKRDDDLYYLTT